ncbi:hypothetical protein [Caryophanon tenue]|uniref:hypothetical protein n=1 Tax=Caryophanon tenue TaxID=33978 RepID=UPI003CCB9B9B
MHFLGKMAFEYTLNEGIETVLQKHIFCFCARFEYTLNEGVETIMTVSNCSRVIFEYTLNEGIKTQSYLLQAIKKTLIHNG